LAQFWAAWWGRCSEFRLDFPPHRPDRRVLRRRELPHSRHCAVGGAVRFHGAHILRRACGISFMLSGYSGLYRSQKIVYSRHKGGIHKHQANKLHCGEFPAALPPETFLRQKHKSYINLYKYLDKSFEPYYYDKQKNTGV
jgi:hypothetical protein